MFTLLSFLNCKQFTFVFILRVYYVKFSRKNDSVFNPVAFYSNGSVFTGYLFQWDPHQEHLSKIRRAVKRENYYSKVHYA